MTNTSTGGARCRRGRQEEGHQTRRKGVDWGVRPWIMERSGSWDTVLARSSISVNIGS